MTRLPEEGKRENHEEPARNQVSLTRGKVSRKYQLHVAASRRRAAFLYSRTRSRASTNFYRSRRLPGAVCRQTGSSRSFRRRSGGTGAGWTRGDGLGSCASAYMPRPVSLSNDREYRCARPEAPAEMEECCATATSDDAKLIALKACRGSFRADCSADPPPHVSAGT